MLRNILWLTFFGLIVGGCASDGKLESSSDSSSTATVPPTASSPAKSDMAATESSSTSPSTSSAAPSDSSARNQPNSSKNRIAAGVEEETLDTCLAGIPQDATAGQRMLAEQTCRRNFAGRF